MLEFSGQLTTPDRFSLSGPDQPLRHVRHVPRGPRSQGARAIIASAVTDSLTPTTALYTKPSFHSYGRDFHSSSNSQTCVNTQEIFGNLVSLSGLQLPKTTRIYRPWIAY